MTRKLRECLVGLDSGSRPSGGTESGQGEVFSLGGEQDDIVALIAAANSTIQAGEDELLAVRRLKTSLLQNLLTGKVRIKIEG